MRDALTSHRDIIAGPDSVQIITGDTLDVAIPENSVDYAITSPPYGVESLSYLRTHLLSYRSLQPLLRYDPYAYNDRLIGSEFLPKQSSHDPGTLAQDRSPEWASTFAATAHLERTKLAVRRRMMARFFDDMVRLSGRLRTYVRPNGRIAFVIGNKKLGDTIMPSDRIVMELFKAAGFGYVESINHKLKCSNTNSEVPWQERTIQDERVLIFEG
jgi:hypothetical protein